MKKLCSLVLLACSAAWPAEPQKTPDDPSRIVLDVNRVNMLFTVSDKKGRFVTDLTKDDFEIVESKKPQIDHRVHRGIRSAAPACRS